MTVPEPPEDAVPPVPAQADPPNTQPDPPAQAATASEDAGVTEERPHPLTPIVQIWVWLVAIGLFMIRQVLEKAGFTGIQTTTMPGSDKRGTFYFARTPQ